MAEAVLGRSAQKRSSILSAGMALFLGNGYQGTSMDQVAATAEVSKQTVYKHFRDKQELLQAIVDEALDSTVTPFLGRVAALADTSALEADMMALAADYLRAVLQERVVQLRRLVIGEANRMPALAREYYDRAPKRVIAQFAECLARLHDRGLLSVPQPDSAAEHFAFLVVGRCIDQALFCGGPKVLADIDVDAYAAAATRVFLAGYRP
ncbi:TetR/AcrR family transcriptional regulator [Mycolicibacterium celeriflavum]|uniref:TetR/AcrR family transcriptional regulator n=1 Tax=Mycolicibacterium celeriflavum TaxID=1249101 RepID=UPI003CEE613E